MVQRIKTWLKMLNKLLETAKELERTIPEPKGGYYMPNELLQLMVLKSYT